MPSARTTSREQRNGGNGATANGSAPNLTTKHEHVRGGDELTTPVKVLPGQVWNDEGVRTGGPVLVICVDSAHAYCRRGREGDGETRRIPLRWFDERRRGGLSLVSDAEGLEDLVERRALTALWELDYVGKATTTETICALLGGFYSIDRVEAALQDAESAGLAIRMPESDGHWRLTGGGRRIAAVA